MVETLPTTKQVETIDKKEFAKVVLDENVKAFVRHVASLSVGSKMIIHLARKTQIALLVAKEVAISAKYLDYADVLLKKSIAELPDCFNIIEHAINLESGKKPLYGLIYSLRPVELKTFKIYIETNLATGFIQLFMSLARAFILFV